MALYALLLAAGAGRRFGGGKLTAPLRGLPLVRHALATAAAAPVAGVVAVLGSHADAVHAAILDDPAAARVRVVVAQDWSEGLSASLRAGMAALPADADGAFIFLGDMPDVPVAVAARLAAAFQAGARAAVPVHLGRRGHPVLLGRDFFGQVSRLSGDTGARSMLELAVPVQVDDPGILRDVDFRADLEDEPRAVHRASRDSR